MSCETGVSALEEIARRFPSRRIGGYHSPEERAKLEHEYDDNAEKVLQERAVKVAVSLGWRRTRAAPGQGESKSFAETLRSSIAHKLAEGLEKSKLLDPQKTWAEDWLAKHAP